jgi:Neuraminidase (sialidase)
MDEGVPDGAVTQGVLAGWSDDGGQTWSHRVWDPDEFPNNSGLTIHPLPDKPEPCLVEVLDVAKPRVSNSLQIAVHEDTLAIAQEVQTDYYNSEVWLAISRDGGQTWPEKAVYSPGALREPAIAFAADGSLLIAGSSRTGDEARPWVVHSRITQ